MKNASKFFEGTTYSDKVNYQMSRAPGEMHSFPEDVKYFKGDGIVEKITGGDGNKYTKLTIPGSYNGKNGNFEFIKDSNGIINHRFFNISEQVGMNITLKDLKKSIGIWINDDEIGFLYKDVFSVLELYRKEKIPVMGGDVYQKKNNCYKPSYANWYFNKNETKEDYLEESIQFAMEYLKKNSFGEEDVFVIVPN